MNQLDFIKETMGIDYIVNPDLAITVEIYKYLVEKYTLSNGIFSSGKVSLLEFPVKKMPHIIGTAMRDMGNVLPSMLVVGISRNGKVIIPHGSTTIQQGDGLYIIGERQPIQKLASKVHEKGKYTNLQKVMIIGGGKTGLYLAKKLSDFGISVKIIERDKARCHYLSTHLDDVMILHGDATDINLLEEENLNDMDAVVTATGFDEENLLLALTAKQHNVEDVIAKVSRESYVGLIEKMGIDMALNPLNITSASILRFIQGSKRVLSSQLIQGQAEIMEIIAAKQMALIGIPIKNLRLPDGVIIAAIHRGMQVIIPSGETKIQENDKVIILCLLSELPDLEKLLSNHKIGFLNRR
jgi:trk system potassium uptake protein TrkA